MKTKKEFEQLIIKSLYSNTQLCSKVLPCIKSDWFYDFNIKLLVDKILNYNSSNGRLPNVTEMKIILENDEVLTKEFNDCLSIPDIDVETDFLLEEIQKWVRKKLLYNTCENILNYVNSDVETNGSFADSITDAETFSFDTNIRI